MSVGESSLGLDVIVLDEEVSRSRVPVSKWRRRLGVEREYIDEFEALSETDLARMARKKGLLSTNHDTVLAIDWPHYCSHATEACGGAKGWCYTFSGFHVSKAQAKKVALNDVLARRLPNVMADIVANAVESAVRQEKLPYPNLRFSGSGELHRSHIPALLAIRKRGVHLWGFTKNPKIAEELSRHGIAVLFSCDHSTPRRRIEEAKALGVGFAYTSKGVEDDPPAETVVTFPVHVSGRVAEVVDTLSLCPKVVEEFLEGVRNPAWCQSRCTRCHLNKGKG